MEQVPRFELYHYVKSMLSEDCYVELHGIADSADIANEYSDLSKEGKAQNMIKIGILNKRGVTTQLVARNFGNLNEETEEKILRFENYGFYSPSKEEMVVVVAIPYYFIHSNGMKIFGGYNEYHPQGEALNIEEAGCITDALFSKVIPPEMILGYYSFKETGSLDTNVTFVKNPGYYGNLSQEEKDKFIDEHFSISDLYDVNDENRMSKIESWAFLSKGRTHTVEQYKRIKNKKTDKF